MQTVDDDRTARKALGLSTEDVLALRRVPVHERIAGLTDVERAAYDELVRRGASRASGVGQVTAEEVGGLGFHRSVLDRLDALDLASLHRGVWSLVTAASRVSRMGTMSRAEAELHGLVPELDAAVAAEVVRARPDGSYSIRTLVIEHDPRWPDDPAPGVVRRSRWCGAHEHWREERCCSRWDAP